MKQTVSKTVDKTVTAVKNTISDLRCTGFIQGNWKDCCVAHDYAYAEGKNKWLADLKLAWCAMRKGHIIVGPVMWVGTTVGGWQAYNRHKEAREYGRSINR